jgi:glucose 1-dehydrogenase
MMKSIAQELAPHKIRVNSIGPGAIRTSINRSEWETPEAEAELRTLIPYDRVGDPEDIAKAAVWLASDASDYVTGITLFVDGGMTLYPGVRGRRVVEVSISAATKQASPDEMVSLDSTEGL